MNVLPARELDLSYDHVNPRDFGRDDAIRAMTKGCEQKCVVTFRDPDINDGPRPSYDASGYVVKTLKCRMCGKQQDFHFAPRNAP